jgi:hypothetical protein
MKAPCYQAAAQSPSERVESDLPERRLGGIVVAKVETKDECR